MKKLTKSTVAIFVALCAIACNRHTAEGTAEGYGKFKDAEVYDSLRNRAYDAAMTIVCLTQKFHSENCDSECCCDYQYVSENDRNILETYRVPDFWVCVHAVEAMDEHGDLTCYEKEIEEYDKALCEYIEYSNQK